jgi:single-stranded-DNA-specific exonuclease
MRGLARLGATGMGYAVPHRFKHGYGLSPLLVDEIAERKPELIVTVDHGIASHAGIARAAELGIPVLVTDHHLPGPTLPAAAAIVNPNQPGDTFPSKALAGVGVMFYLLLATRAELRAQDWFNHQRREPELGELLDLVAVGTVADMVPLDRNNRVLVAAGLRRIRAGHASTGPPRAAHRGRQELLARDRLGPRLRAGPEAQRRRPARGHGARRRVPHVRRPAPRAGDGHSPRQVERRAPGSAVRHDRGRGRAGRRSDTAGRRTARWA